MPEQATKPRSGSLDDRHPLAEAKLLAPRLRPGMVERPRIQRVLDEAQAGLTLVAAPAGYGKTTAVRAWSSKRDTGLAWVTLDRGDNDPARLWRYVATAVDRVRGGLGQPALRRLRLPGGSIEDAVVELMNGIGGFEPGLDVVLDDFQVVTDRECLASVERAIDQLPRSTRLVLLTRADPALRLPQLRASGSLTELRTSELAFLASEAMQLLVEHGGLPLDAEEVRILCERTEGWPGALYLALLWLRTVPDVHRSVREFSGNHRFVADYLNQEVLGALDDESRAFLLRASILNEFTPELCDGIFGRTDATAMLERLEQTNLLVDRLEHGNWFRVHPLLGEFARFQLAARDNGAAHDIHLRAAAWFRERRLFAQAVEHAAAGGDRELVAEILSEHHSALLRTGQSRMLLRWVRALSDDELVRRPELATAGATAAALLGQGALECRRLLQVAERARLERPDRFSVSVEANLGALRALTLEGGVARALSQGRRAVATAEAGADGALVWSLASFGHALSFAGAAGEAWNAALAAVQHPEAERRPVAQAVARSTLALVAVEQGRLVLARGHAEKAKSLIGRVRSSRSWIGAVAATALGVVFAAEGHLVEAERELVHAEPFFRDEVPTVHHAWVLLLVARVRCRRGRLDEAQSALRAALEELDAIADGGVLPELAAGLEAELGLATALAHDGRVVDQPSDAELAVLRLLTSDLSAREIGKVLFLSQNTVRTHTRVLYRKLGVNSRVEAVGRATALGYLARAGAGAGAR